MTDTIEVREAVVRYRGPRYRMPAVVEACDVAELVAKLVSKDAREHFIALFLDGHNQPIGYQVVSVGTANASLVHPREVFQAAIKIGAVGVIIAHNHPSGVCRPSPEDRIVTERLAKAGALIGIRLVDHVVCGDGEVYSFRLEGEL